MYREHGYAKANTGEPQTNVRNAGGINPFTLRPSKGKRVDILIPVEEGERYRLGDITFTDNKAITNTAALRAQFPIKDGDWFNGKLFVKGLENLRKAYGSQGYINFVGTPTPALRRGQAHHQPRTSTATKASSSTSRASSSPATRSPATRSSAASS